MKTLKNMKCYWCEHHHGEERTVETCVCDHENFPSESLVSSRDLREEAKRWRDELEEDLKVAQSVLDDEKFCEEHMDSPPLDPGYWELECCRLKAKIEFINTFFNLNEEGEE